MPRHELRDHLGIHQSLQYLSFQGNAEVMGGSPGLQKQISALKKAHDFILYSDIISLFFEQSSREMSGDIRKKWVRRAGHTPMGPEDQSILRFGL
jgi:hypothetical protein